MKFGKLLLHDRVPEWAEAYIEYNTLKKLLAPAKILQKKFVTAIYKEGNLVFHITNRKNLRVEEVVFCIRSFEDLIKSEIVKIDKFFMYKLLDVMKRYKYLMINSSFVGKSLHNQQKINNEQKLKYSFKIYYKELNMIKEYIKLNEMGLQKILKKYSKVVKSLIQTEHQDFNLAKRVTSGQYSTYLARNKDKLMDIIKKTEENYINLFYPDISQQKMGRVDFRLYTNPKPLSPNQILFYGVFCGISFILLLFIVLKFVQVYSENPTAVQKTRLSTIFPLFRGNGLFITNIWLIAWNVHGWQNNHINYKLIFKLNHHFSQMYQILKRASFFTFFYFVCFVWFLFLNTPHQDTSGSGGSVDLYVLIDWIDMELLPLFGWFMLFGYYFFPFFNVSFFNPQGRLYFFRLLGDCLKSPFVKMEFRISWMTDMLVSMAGPLKDFGITICFYLSKFHIISDQCSNSSVMPFLLNIIPTLYRMFQCIRQGYDNKKFWRTWPFYNCIKYIFSLLTSILSYQYTVNSEKKYLISWLLIGSFSTLISFYWDISQDWGLLKIGKTWKETRLIGRQLYYSNKNIYLFAIFSNFILRIVWAMNISLGLTAIIDNAINIPGMFTFIVYFLELFRRCQWNFFRVELEHINNCNKYKAVVDLELPIQIDTSSVIRIDPIQNNYQTTLLTENAPLKGTNWNLVDIDVESNNIKIQNNELLTPKINEYIESEHLSPINVLNHRDNKMTEQNGFNQQMADIFHKPYQISINTATIDHMKLSNARAMNEKQLNNLGDGANIKESNRQKRKNLVNEEIKQLESFETKKQDDNNDTFVNQFKREEIKIQAALKQFQDQLSQGVSSKQTKQALKVLKSIKPFLKHEQLNQVQIQSEMLSYVDEESVRLKI
ncbi:hypothetical protein ABPG72_001481 [Tetrahymena utriculariae]